MRTRSSSNLPVESPPNPSTSNPKRRNCRRSKQPFILEESPVDTMADQRTMTELLRAPTEGYIEAWDRYKDLLCACPHHGFTELYQLDTFCNALNPADQDSLNSAAGGNLLERRTQDVLTIIENKSMVRNSRNKLVVSQVKSSDANSNSSSEISKLTYAVNQQKTAINYNHGNSGYRPLGMANQIRPPGFVQPNVQNNQNLFSQPQGYNRGNNFNQDQSYQAPTQQNEVVPLSKLEKVKRMIEANMKSMQTQINNVKNGLRNEMKNSIQASLSNQTNELKNMMASFFQMNTASTLGTGSLPSNTIANLKGELKAITLKVQKMLKALLSNKEKLLVLENTPLNENCSAVILKKLPEKLGDLGKFPILCGFNKLKYKALANLGIPFLRTARALIDVHGEEMILRDSDERLTLNMRHDTSSYSNQPQKESINQGGNVLLEKLLDLDSTKDLHSPLHVNPLSGSTTSSSSLNKLLKEFADELALITFSTRNDDLPFDIESNLKEIEYMLHHDSIKDINSILKDLIDQNNLVDLNDDLVDSMPEMFTDEHALDYSSPPLYDEYDDDLFKVESDIENVYDDPFDSKGEKIKESKLLVDELNIPCDFLLHSEYDSFISEDFSEVDALPLTNNKEKVFNLGILIQENLFEIITHVAQDKKLAISHVSLMLEDFDPSLYELPFLKKFPRLIHIINRNICLRFCNQYPFHEFIIMSNINNNMQTQTSNTLHNAIMEAGSKDRLPMLAPDPLYELGWKDKEVPTSEGSLVTRTERVNETYKNVSQDIRDQLNAEAEAVQIILTGIDNDIYSTIDACPNACKMWKEIERLKQGESINLQDLETNLYWEFGKFTSQDGESLESYCSRFYKMMNELIRNQCKVTNHQVNVQFLLQLQPEWQRFVTLVKQSQELKTVSYHKLYDILKQHQHEVNEIRAEKIARVANPLALVAQ
nr:reverse transcriptase domain-containing protein [Tanacetum cinerariifolium]